MNLRWVAAAVWLCSSSVMADAQWRAVDGGFQMPSSISRWPEVPTRTIEGVVAAEAGGVSTFTDSNDPRTALKLEFLDGVRSDTRVDLRDGGAVVSWADGTNLRNIIRNPTLLTFFVDTAFLLTLSPGQVATSLDDPGLFAFASRGTLISGADRPHWVVSGPCSSVQRDAGVTIRCMGNLELAVVSPQPEFRPSWFLGSSIVSTDENALVVSEDPRAWAWRAETGWYRLATGPGARFRSGVAFDSQRRRVVVFGGALDGGLLDDTWEFDGATWSERQPSRRPPPRTTGSMAFDPRRGRTVLFGGYANGLELGDTWEWDGTDWSELAIDAGPSPRDAVALAWDGRRQEVLLFGGWDGLTVRDDTWSWDGTRWVELSPATRVAARSSGSMVWSPALNQVVLAGANNDNAQRSAALWDGTTWTALPDVDLQKRAALISLGDGGVFWVSNNGARSSSAQLINGRWVTDTTKLAGVGTLSEDGGSVLLAGGFRWEWRSEAWVPQQTLPFALAASATATPPNRLLVLANRAPTQTWESVDGVWTNRGSSGFTGPLVTTLPSGVTLGFQGNEAFEWTGRAWATHLWPTTVAVTDAVTTSLDDSFYVGTNTSTIRVDASGSQQALGGRAPGRLLNGGRGWPVALGTPFISDLSLSLQQWTPVVSSSRGNLTPAGRDAQGRPLLVDFVQVPLETFIYDPTRSQGAECAHDWQCHSGACVDGRCCDGACTSDATCRACSVERGASEDGVCTVLTGVSCAPAEGDDGGIMNPPPDAPKGCGCSGVLDGAAGLALLFWARRRRQSRRTFLVT